MLVVSDASPLNVLVRTSLVHVLPQLYGQIVIPSAVAAELFDANAPPPVREFITVVPSWLIVRDPQTLLVLAGLDAGERAAISLAKEIDAALLLVDEKRGRRAAQELGLRVAGTIGVLELPAERGLVDLRDALARIRQTDFRVSDQILKNALQRDADRRSRG